MKSLPGEEWRFLEDSNDVYVSNLGRLKRKNKIVPTQLNKDGYLQASFGPKIGRRLVHRIVCMVWHPETWDEDHNIVDHIDGCKLNNAADNLRWCSVAENSQYYYDLRGKNTLNSRTGYIVMIKKETNEGFIYKTISEASRALDIGAQQISNMLRYPGVRAYSGYTAFRLVGLDNLIYHDLKDGTAISGNSIENGNWAEIKMDDVLIRITDNREETRRLNQPKLRKVVTNLLDKVDDDLDLKHPVGRPNKK